MKAISLTPCCDTDLRKFEHAKGVSLYEKALRAYAADESFDDAEQANLGRLRHLLGLGPQDLALLEKTVLDPIYGSAVRSALADDHLSDIEKMRLKKLRTALRLTEERALAIYREHAERVVQGRWDEALADRRLSDEEISSLESMATNLSVRPETDQESRSAIERFRLFWRLENGNLPIESVNLNLQRGEVCHFSVPATWHEQRTVTTSIRYGGPVVRIRIMKGLYYRAGAISIQKVTREEVQQISSGALYITSKRLVFSGKPKNGAITFKSILSFTPYSDGIAVDKTSGRAQIFLFNDSELGSMILAAALAAA